MENNDQLAGTIQEGNVAQQLPFHLHNGVDSPLIDITPYGLASSPVNLADNTKVTGTLPVANGGTGATTLSAHYVLAGNGTGVISAISPNTSGFVLTSNGAASDPSFTQFTPSTIAVSVTAGETLTAGEIVFLYKAGGDDSSRGYGQTGAAIYASRAAANDTTYGSHILGIVAASAEYLATTTVLVAGKSSSFSGLTEATVYYLKDYGASTETISQTTSDAEVQITGAGTATQTFIPTSSKMDKITVKISGGDFTLSLKRGNTVLATEAMLGSGSAIEKTMDFADLRVYKGELLTLEFSASATTTNILCKLTGNPYNALYGATEMKLSGTDTDIPASGADIYFRVYEYPNFGKVHTAAGTRKIKVGVSGAATEMYWQPQVSDAIL